MSSLLEFSLLETLGAVVTYFATRAIPKDPGVDTSQFGSWFLSPRQHGAEFVIFNLLIGCFLAYNLRSAYRQAREEFTKTMAVREFSKHPMVRVMDWVIIMALVATLLITIYYKVQRNTYLFLLQPCHMSVLLLLILMLHPGGENSALRVHFLFNVYLHISWGGMLAIAFPDTRGYSQLLEMEMFWIEHAFLVIVPIYMMLTRRFQVFKPSPNMGFTSFLMFALYHSFVLASLALASGRNLNYVMNPPPGLLEYFGKYYRIVMYMGCLPLTFMTRYVFWQPIYWVIDEIHYTLGVRPTTMAASQGKLRKKKSR